MFVRFLIDVPAERNFERYDQSRAVVAKAAERINDRPFVLELLHRKDVPTHPARDGLSPFRFTTARDGRALAIIGLGQQAVQTLVEKGRLISQAVAEELGISAVDTGVFGRCSVAPAPRMAHYRIARMVIQKYGYDKKGQKDGEEYCEKGRFRKAEEEHRETGSSADLCEHVEKLILRDLLRQAELMGLDFPENVRVGDLALEDLKPVRVVPGRMNLSARVRFSLTHVVKGPWGAGHMQARGYGGLVQNFNL
jgi:hypothetical protein